MGEGLDGEDVVGADTADGADPVEVVAEQVNDHQVLGTVFAVGGQVFAQLLVITRGVAAGSGALDGFRFDLVVDADPEESFG